MLLEIAHLFALCYRTAQSTPVSATRVKMSLSTKFRIHIELNKAYIFGPCRTEKPQVPAQGVCRRATHFAHFGNSTDYSLRHKLSKEAKSFNFIWKLLRNR